MKRLVALLFCLVLLPFVSIQAQTAANVNDIIGDFTFALSPEVPGPNQLVDVSIENFSVDLQTSTITWVVNGARLASGKGLTHVQVSMGGPGSHTTIAVSIANGTQNFERSITISPGEVDMLWQGDTYIPPFYKGRALWTDESNATILAIPHVSASTNLIYKWSVNGTIYGDKSGVGRNTFTITKAPLSLPEKIKVSIMTDSNTVVAEGLVTLYPGAPQLSVYEDNPLYGVLFNNAVNANITLRDKEVSFTAFPLFMNISGRNNQNLNYKWTVSGTANVQKGSRVTYRVPDGGAGGSKIDVNITNTATTFQGADKDFLVQFDNANNF